jgi:hypothetical protein
MADGKGGPKKWWSLKALWPAGLRSHGLFVRSDALYAFPSSRAHKGDSYSGNISGDHTLHFTADDDVSSLSFDAGKHASSFRRKSRLRCCDPSSVPFEVFVPFRLDMQLQVENFACGEVTEANADRHQEDNVHQEGESTPKVASTHRITEDQGCAELRELDPEGRARLRAIQQLSSMMGPDHPDVLFSMQYLSKHLYKLGDVRGALAIQDHIQERRSKLHAASSYASGCV